LVAREDVDIVVVAVPGLAALDPLLCGIRHHKTIALANKESVVAAGHLIRRKLAHSRATLLPLDSEHCGIFQAGQSC
jgi:1-deoxy-D-xylulose-5-phosphate reductoisomerase